MAISLGTRNRDNMRFGAGEVYIAEGGTITAPGSFVETISNTDLTTLLSNFSRLGTLAQNPKLETEPITVSEIDSTDNTLVRDRQHQSRVMAKFEVLEMDNTLVNVLVTRAEAATKTDFLFLRTQDEGDFISFLRNAPFSIKIIRNHTWENVEKVEVAVNVLCNSLKKVTGQKRIDNTPV